MHRSIHITHWAHDGITSLDTLTLLCDHHHDEVHHHGWDVRMAPDRRPEYLPPAWIDSQRKPRRNTYWDNPLHRTVRQT